MLRRAEHLPHHTSSYRADSSVGASRGFSGGLSRVGGEGRPRQIRSLNVSQTGTNANHLRYFHGGGQSGAVVSRLRVLRLGHATLERSTLNLPDGEPEKQH